MGYARAVAELYQVPVSEFVAERKRLADELAKAGDAAGAKQLRARKRPTISAWVVNQLYWHARDAFDALMASAKRLREGDLDATPAHRDAIAKLRARAAAMLKDAQHAPTEATLRRVTGTLAALAATGGFDPDEPGALAEDREPPGFEAAAALAAAPPRKSHAHGGAHAAQPAATSDHAERARREAERRAEELARRERARLDTAIATARGIVEARERDVDMRARDLDTAKTAAREAKAKLHALERDRAKLGD